MEEPGGAAGWPRQPPCTLTLQGWKQAHEAAGFLAPAQLTDSGQLRAGPRCALSRSPCPSSPRLHSLWCRAWSQPFPPASSLVGAGLLQREPAAGSCSLGPHAGLCSLEETPGNPSEGPVLQKPSLPVLGTLGIVTRDLFCCALISPRCRHCELPDGSAWAPSARKPWQSCCDEQMSEYMCVLLVLP